MSRRVFVTDHALTRWRQRAAEYGDAKADELVAAFAEADHVSDDEPLPIARTDGTEYRFHKKTGTYLIAEPRALDIAVVITVILPGEPYTFVNPKTPTAPTPTPAEKKLKKQSGLTPEQFADVVRRRQGFYDEEINAVFDDEPEFADVGAERDWLLGKMKALQAKLSGMNRSHAQYKLLASQASAVIVRLGDIKPKWREWLVARDRAREESGELHRPDGSISFGVAVKMLLEKVAVLEKRVAVLEAR